MFYVKSSPEKSHNLPHNRPFLLHNVTSWKFCIISQYLSHTIKRPAQYHCMWSLKSTPEGHFTFSLRDSGDSRLILNCHLIVFLDRNVICSTWSLSLYIQRNLLEKSHLTMIMGIMLLWSSTSFRGKNLYSWLLYPEEALAINLRLPVSSVELYLL